MKKKLFCSFFVPLIIVQIKQADSKPEHEKHDHETHIHDRSHEKHEHESHETHDNLHETTTYKLHSLDILGDRHFTKKFPDLFHHGNLSRENFTYFGPLPKLVVFDLGKWISFSCLILPAWTPRTPGGIWVQLCPCCLWANFCFLCLLHQ